MSKKSKTCPMCGAFTTADYCKNLRRIEDRAGIKALRKAAVDFDDEIAGKLWHTCEIVMELRQMAEEMEKGNG